VSVDQTDSGALCGTAGLQNASGSGEENVDDLSFMFRSNEQPFTHPHVKKTGARRAATEIRFICISD
jgi:hypothetical protein